MTSGYLGLLMLGLIVVAIMMGFPTAFTLMGLGMLFGYVAYFDPTQSMVANRIFDLMVQRTYGGMTNDTLLSIPLFVLMGYVIERAALVDKMFRAVQLSFRRLPCPKVKSIMHEHTDILLWSCRRQATCTHTATHAHTRTHIHTHGYRHTYVHAYVHACLGGG